MIVYCLILFAAAAVFLILGVLIFRGKTDLIHDYHQANIKASDQKEYGRSFAKGMFGLALTLILSGSIALFGESKPILFASIAVLFAGMIASFIWIGKIQKKYNGGIF